MNNNCSFRSVPVVSLITGIAAFIVTAAFTHMPSGYAHDIGFAHQHPHPPESVPTVKDASWFKSEEKKEEEIKSLPVFSFADLAERVETAVVNISTSKVIKKMPFQSPNWRFGPGNDPFDDFFEKFFGDLPNEGEMHSLGSGFIISKEGEIITNYHVIARADDITVKLSNGKTYKATVVGGDEKRDVAVVKISAKEALPFVKLGDSSAMRPGDWVMAIGNPLGLDHTVTVGVVSATNRKVSEGPFAKFIQTDCSINPGNSGGPLFNVKGEVIGVNSMIYANAQGIGFSIPIDLVKQLLPDLLTKGKVSRGWLGVSIQPVTEELAKSFGMEKAEGALISDVNAGSPAAKSGLKRGDVILKIGDERLVDPKDLAVVVANTSPGKELDVEFMRDGKVQIVKVKIGVYEESKSLGAKGESGALGLVVRAITLEDRSQLDVPTNFKGVVVEGVNPDSASGANGIREGDVILEVNNEKIFSVEDYNRVTGKLKKGDLVRIFLKRGRSSIYIAFQL